MLKGYILISWNAEGVNGQRKVGNLCPGLWLRLSVWILSVGSRSFATIIEVCNNLQFHFLSGLHRNIYPMMAEVFQAVQVYFIFAVRIMMLGASKLYSLLWIIFFNFCSKKKLQLNGRGNNFIIIRSKQWMYGFLMLINWSLFETPEKVY